MSADDDPPDDVSIARKIVEVQQRRFDRAVSLLPDRAESREDVDLIEVDLLGAMLDLRERIDKHAGEKQSPIGLE
jgi:hypothetical protein